MRLFLLYNWTIGIRGRPFNLQGGGWCYGFLFRSEINFRTTRELEYFFFCHAKHEIFFQNLTLGYTFVWQKLWIRLFFFSSTKIRIFFSATLGIRINFFRKKTSPPLQVKWSIPKWKADTDKRIMYFKTNLILFFSSHTINCVRKNLGKCNIKLPKNVHVFTSYKYILHFPLLWPTKANSFVWIKFFG